MNFLQKNSIIIHQECRYFCDAQRDVPVNRSAQKCGTSSLDATAFYTATVLVSYTLRALRALRIASQMTLRGL